MSLADPIIGIDLGTTNSLVTICDSTGPRVIPDPAGRALLPSVVRYDRAPDGSIRAVVGHDALAQAPAFPQGTIASIKRLMGRSRRDAEAELPHLSYDVIEGPHSTARARVPVYDPGARDGPHEWIVRSPQEVSASILSELRSRASAALGAPVQRAVITVPAYFDDAQRQATRDAGRMAGLDVVRIIAEPTAAALAYGLGAGLSRADGRERTIAVYDLGGGTFDVSILRITPGEGAGEPAFFQVLSTSGDTHLGGDDLDQSIVLHLLSEAGDPAGAALARLAALPGDARARLVEAAREAKHRLSNEHAALVRCELGPGRALEATVTREDLDRLSSPLIERTLAACAGALRDAAPALEGEPLDGVVLVGGMTRMPAVRERVKRFFGLDPYAGIDPDQVVALGAAVQASILQGARRDALLLDVIPLSLGIETVGGAVAKVIMRNTTVPARAREMFSTSVDNQTAIRLHVLQGEREMAGDCRSLGVFSLRVPPMPAGMPQVEVDFGVDANGVLTVTATERRSGRRADVQIVPNHGLSRDEVERIERDSLAHAREDMTRHQVVDLVTNSRLDLKWIGDRLARYGSLLDDASRASLAATADALRALVEAADADWRSADVKALQAAKAALDRGSVRLQEIAITQSLREGSG
ncbi:MAG: Hsp70 family protein [Phycisphaerales bacterium]|nr:Hsp70 family protein [Phycisphaerales bacterium]